MLCGRSLSRACFISFCFELPFVLFLYRHFQISFQTPFHLKRAVCLRARLRFWICLRLVRFLAAPSSRLPGLSCTTYELDGRRGDAGDHKLRVSDDSATDQRQQILSSQESMNCYGAVDGLMKISASAWVNPAPGRDVWHNRDVLLGGNARAHAGRTWPSY